MKKFKLEISKLLLVILLVLGFGLRLYNVAHVPPGLTWDEAALGYNAYSLLKTGKDEYGAVLPLNLKSFGDYKPALYAYLDIPFIAVFGLNELAVRLPSVLTGVIFIWVMFALMQELFQKKWLSVTTALFAAISPLSLQFSRGAWESNVATVLNLGGVYLFLKAQKNNWWYTASFGLFALSLLTYQGSRLFVLLLLIGLFILYRNDLKFKAKGLWVGSGILGIIGGILMVTLLFFGQGDRLSTTNFFAYTRSDEQINQVIQEDGLARGSLPYEFLHGEWFAYVRGLVERYVVYYSPNILFVTGDYSPRHKVADMGVFPYYTLILFLLGIYFLTTLKSKGLGVLVLYLLIAPLPGVLSRDLINMVRALNLLIPFTILEAAGFYFLVVKLYRSVVGKLALVVAVGVMIGIYGMYLDSYFVHTPAQYSQGYLYGYKQSLLLANARNKDLWDSYDKVVMTDTYGQPYIYYLFYSQYDPAKYQQQANLDRDTVDVGSVKQIDNIEFRHVFWPGDRGAKNSLFIGTLEELPDQDVKPFAEYNLKGDVHFLDNQHAFRVVETAK
jgi:4-amino-4-deoxy-L-arabinose transferase-like glycosyltransferase